METYEGVLLTKVIECNSLFLIFLSCYHFQLVLSDSSILANGQGSTNLESIQIIKKAGGSLKDSFLDEG